MNNWDSGIKPKVRRGDVYVEKVGSETIVYDKGTHKTHCLNAAMSSVWELADGSRTLGEIAETLEGKFGIPQSSDAVVLSMEQLESFGLLEAGHEVASVGDIRSRRQIALDLAKAGLSLSVLPLVASVVAPTPAMAASASTPVTLADYQHDLGIVANDIRQNSNAFLQSPAARADFKQGLTTGGQGVVASLQGNNTLAQNDFQSAVSDFDGALKALNLGPL